MICQVRGCFWFLEVSLVGQLDRSEQVTHGSHKTLTQTQSKKRNPLLRLNRERTVQKYNHLYDVNVDSGLWNEKSAMKLCPHRPQESATWTSPSTSTLMHRDPSWLIDHPTGCRLVSSAGLPPTGGSTHEEVLDDGAGGGARRAADRELTRECECTVRVRVQRA